MSTNQVVEGFVFEVTWPEVRITGDHDCSLFNVRPQISPHEVNSDQVVNHPAIEDEDMEKVAVGNIHVKISPIDKLCDDVLRSVFLGCAAAYGNNYYDFYLDEMETLGHPWTMKNNVAARPMVKLPLDKPFLTPSCDMVPFLFLSVNRRWRRVAQDTHTLWNRISVMPNLSGERRPTARFIRHWLQLSGDTTPLSLHIAPSDISCFQNNYNRTYKFCKEEKEERATLGLFFEHAERCKVLSIQFNKALYQKLDELLYPDSLQETSKEVLFTRVETLEIRTELVNRQYHLAGWLGTFPSLRHFYLVEGPLSKVDVNELPISSLETIYLHKNLPFSDAVNFLRKCTTATEISWKGIDATVPSPQIVVLSEPQTVLPNLTKLSIRECPPPGPFAALSYFTMSNLRELEIGWPVMGPVYPFRGERDSVVLSEFLARSGCHLDRLAIVDILIDNKDVKDILCNPIVLRIPEVDIVYASETLPHSPIGRRMFCSHPKSPDILRYGGGNQAFFLSQHIGLLFWTTQEIIRPRQFQPYELWEHVGWSKNYKGETQTVVWKDTVQQRSYPIKFKLE